MEDSLIYQAYYTKSVPIVDYMVGMLHPGPEDTILEPCGGDGVFVDRILDIAPQADVRIFELNPLAAESLRRKYGDIKNVSVKETDTLLDESIISRREKFDKIIGNPPYGARSDERKKELLERLYKGFYKKESYALFLYACTRCLNENGELSFIVPDTFLSLHRHSSLRKYLLLNTKIRELALFPSSFFPGVNFGYANLCIITLTKSFDVKANMQNRTVIRTGFRNVYELEERNSGRKKIVSQESVYESVGSAFMFDSSDRVIDLMNDDTTARVGDIADCVTGFYSGNDKHYLHPLNAEIKNAKKYTCACVESIRKSGLTEKEKRDGIASGGHLIPIVKGGNIGFVKADNWFMDWSEKAVGEYRKSKKCRFQNSGYYFRSGIGIPMIRSSRLTGALIENRLFDQSIVGVFPKDETLVTYLLGFFNSTVCTELIKAINPSANNSANYIKKIPFIMPSEEIREKVETLVEKIVSALKNGNGDVEECKQEIDEIFSGLYYGRDGYGRASGEKAIAKQPGSPGLFNRYDNEPTVGMMVHDDGGK